MKLTEITMLNNIKTFFVLIFLLTFISCSDSILNNPDPVSNQKSNVYQSGSLNNDIIRTEADTESSELNTVTDTINGKMGGVIQLVGSRENPDSKDQKVRVVLAIPPGSFEGIRVITLTADYETASLICEPNMDFDTPLNLQLTYMGLDIDTLGFTIDKLFFAYLGDDGTIKPVPNDGLSLDTSSGLLGVRNAKIEHFSRYGFSR